MAALQEQTTTYMYFDNISRQSLLALIVFLLLIIILLVLLFFRFLHVHVSGGHHDQEGASSSSSSDGGIIVGGVQVAVLPPSSIGLDAAKINSLPIFMRRFSESSSNNSDEGGRSSSTTYSSFMDSECSICLGTFEDEEMIKVMPECLHAFHSECVDKWLTTRSTCPLCRSSIDFSSNNDSSRP